MLPTEIGYRTLKILIQYMYSGEATVTNDQLEGVLKAGDILRVRGLWRSNTGGSKKENIQSNNQKIERDKREPTQLAGQIQKIKLIQPTAQEKLSADSAQQACQNNAQPTKPTVERKSTEKTSEEKAVGEAEPNKVLEESQSNEQNKNKENLETNSKKKKVSTVNSDVESTKSKSSEGGENVRRYLFFFIRW